MSLREPVGCGFLQHKGGVNMVVEQDEAQAQTLRDLVERALRQADAIGDYLIAALLSQCLVLMQKSPPPEH
jgi:hypothetical protein